jgi:hypothetical protein
VTARGAVESLPKPRVRKQLHGSAVAGNKGSVEVLPSAVIMCGAPRVPWDSCRVSVGITRNLVLYGLATSTAPNPMNSWGPAASISQTQRSFQVSDRGRSTQRSVGMGLCQFGGTASGVFDLASSGFWTDRREDKMINLASGLWPIFGPLRPPAGHGRPGNGPGSKNSAGNTQSQPRKPIISPIRGHFVFLGPTANR